MPRPYFPSSSTASVALRTTSPKQRRLLPSPRSFWHFNTRTSCCLSSFLLDYTSRIRPIRPSCPLRPFVGNNPCPSACHPWAITFFTFPDLPGFSDGGSRLRNHDSL